VPPQLPENNCTTALKVDEPITMTLNAVEFAVKVYQTSSDADPAHPG
jgi:hypothetical protein